MEIVALDDCRGCEHEPDFTQSGKEEQ